MTAREPLPLEPCPCCTSKLALHENDWADPPLWHAYCPSCGLHFAEMATKEKAIEAANRRPPGAREEALKEALTPSGETKGAYSGEFYWMEGARGNLKRVVPWPTIKEIMAAIRQRALAGGTR